MNRRHELLLTAARVFDHGVPVSILSKLIRQMEMDGVLLLGLTNDGPAPSEGEVALC